MTDLPVPPVDPGNRLLAETPAQMTYALVPTPAGQRLAVTFRTPSTTFSVFLNKDDAGGWADALRAGADSMSGLTVIRDARAEETAARLLSASFPNV